MFEGDELWDEFTGEVVEDKNGLFGVGVGGYKFDGLKLFEDIMSAILSHKIMLIWAH